MHLLDKEEALCCALVSWRRFEFRPAYLTNCTLQRVSCLLLGSITEAPQSPTIPYSLRLQKQHLLLSPFAAALLHHFADRPYLWLQWCKHPAPLLHKTSCSKAALSLSPGWPQRSTNTQTPDFHQWRATSTGWNGVPAPQGMLAQMPHTKHGQIPTGKAFKCQNLSSSTSEEAHRLLQ